MVIPMAFTQLCELAFLRVRLQLGRICMAFVRFRFLLRCFFMDTSGYPHTLEANAAKIFTFFVKDFSILLISACKCMSFSILHSHMVKTLHPILLNLRLFRANRSILRPSFSFQKRTLVLGMEQF